ncbi:uncharacterized protein N7469_001440 [Penicillium citrinum]|uniref:Rhodopsin domain-containing protein n=2 Tax=Penicillium TaxID=5073 RepID=A0A9W9TVZ2_PENCI|nr:uncharacterized protein N7469_001440 [Penicillium citrinum]KAJ5243113.1 hypothetical protein N7469_001440 [Penicillium citrinum]KAJ5599388.1 hypothetical protein N7450_000455 [Penicillium hetheringtonii]
MASNVEAWVLLSLALFIIIVRACVRWNLVGPANFQLDDYLMPLAGIVFILETVAAYLVGAKYEGLTNSYMTDEQRKTLDSNSKEWANREAGAKIQIIGWSLYVAILWLVKFSLAVFYSRLTTGLQSLPTRVRIAYGILGVTWIATQLSLLLSCQPFHAFWQINPNPGAFCQPTNSPVYVFVVVILNIVTDIYLLSIPLPLLWTVNISLKRKIPLMALFSGAAFVITASIIRGVTIVSSGPDGASAGSKWACRETFVSIVVSNLPIIQPLLRRGFKKIGLASFFSSSAKPSGHSYPLSGLKTLTNRGDRDTKKSKVNTAAPSHMQASAWGSDEHILTEPDHTSKDITVVSETVVQSEPWSWEEASASHSTTPPKEWKSHMSER